MFKKIFFLFLIALFSFANDRFIVLCYHNIEDNPKDKDIMSISTDKFIQQLNWLNGHDYHPISIDDLIKAKKGIKKLPKKAVLLTFDDAYKTFFTRVFPILKAYNYPAVLAVVGKWMQTPKNQEFLYGDKKKKRELLLSWRELKEISDSGLVEIASHSYDLHHGVLANPQGNMEPAATSRIYNPKTKSYESDKEYIERVKEDLKKNSELLYKKLGKRPRVVVWPYGEYNKITIKIAKELGMEITLTLDDGSNTLKDIDRLKRILLYGKDSLYDFVSVVKNPDKKPIIRVVHIDLDYIYDRDPIQQEKNLGRLLDRIKDYKINTVFLQAFADPDGDGVADALYFPNRYLPVRADLFNRVSWQLYTRCGVEVFAWMPVMAFDIKNRDDLYVKKYNIKSDKIFIDKKVYKRVSIFNKEAKKIVKGIYEDLAKYVPLNGILFHDDAFLSDFEDADEEALRVYKKMELGNSIKKIRENKELMKRWTEFKTDSLILFTKELEKVVKKYRPNIKTARNIYARVIIEPSSKEWFAQDYEKFLENYDYVAIMAMPYMEEAKNPDRWLKKLINHVKRCKKGAKKSIFELQSKDWREDRFVDSNILAKQMRLLQINRILNYGYYPDDFLKDNPNQKIIYSVFSLNRYPFIRR